MANTDPVEGRTVTTKYVVLTFDDADDHPVDDYDPPLLHPAAVFASRCTDHEYLRGDLGASEVSAVLDHMPNIDLLASATDGLSDMLEQAVHEHDDLQDYPDDGRHD